MKAPEDVEFWGGEKEVKARNKKVVINTKRTKNKQKTNKQNKQTKITKQDKTNARPNERLRAWFGVFLA